MDEVRGGDEVDEVRGRGDEVDEVRGGDEVDEVRGRGDEVRGGAVMAEKVQDSRWPLVQPSHLL